MCRPRELPVSNDLKNSFAQGCAWLTAIIGGLTFEMWLALAGLGVSAFIAWTNFRSRRLQDRLLIEEAERSRQLHELEVERLRRGLDIEPVQIPDYVRALVAAKDKP